MLPCLGPVFGGPGLHCKAAAAGLRCKPAASRQPPVSAASSRCRCRASVSRWMKVELRADSRGEGPAADEGAKWLAVSRGPGGIGRGGRDRQVPDGCPNLQRCEVREQHVAGLLGQESGMQSLRVDRRHGLRPIEPVAHRKLQHQCQLGSKERRELEERKQAPI